MIDPLKPSRASKDLSYVEALRAVHRPRTDKENAFLRDDIARRYALHQRRRREADPVHFMAVRRIDELEHVFLDRYGLYLPDDDAGWEDFTIMAHHFAHLRGATGTSRASLNGPRSGLRLSRPTR